MKLLNKYSLFFLLTIFLFLAISIKFDAHFFDSRTDLNLENLQGLECIKDKNDLYIISAENGSSMYDARSLSKIASFQNPSKDYQRAINFMANTNSFIKIGGIGVAVNTTSRRAPNMTTYDFKKHIDSGYLSDDVVISVLPQNEYENLHIEQINFGEDRYILFSGVKNSIPTIEFLKMNKTNSYNEAGLNIPNIEPICEIPGKSKTQNIYWDDSRAELVFARNAFFTRGSKLDRVKFINPESLKKGICPNFITLSSTLILTHKELEAYSRCGNSEYFLYNHTPTLYERISEK